MKSDFMKSKDFRLLLQNKIEAFAHFIYDITKNFPNEERYGITSQIRRASLSVLLNFVEGFARNNDKVYQNFLKISYGSLKETECLINFCYKEKMLNQENLHISQNQIEEISKMLWKIMQG